MRMISIDALFLGTSANESELSENGPPAEGRAELTNGYTARFCARIGSIPESMIVNNLKRGCYKIECGVDQYSRRLDRGWWSPRCHCAALSTDDWIRNGKLLSVTTYPNKNPGWQNYSLITTLRTIALLFLMLPAMPVSFQS
jgi:hypothetical protein